MTNFNKGFTLVELVVVMVLIGILAAVAIPRFTDLSGEAETAALKGIVASIESGSAINFAAFKASDGNKGEPIDLKNTDCVTAIAAALPNGLPGDYELSQSKAKITAGVDGYGICEIKRKNSSYSRQALLMLTS